MLTSIDWFPIIFWSGIICVTVVLTCVLIFLPSEAASEARKRREYEVHIYLKAGKRFDFECDNLEITLDPEDSQKIQKLTWDNAYPKLMFLHLDNIASVLYYHSEE